MSRLEQLLLPYLRGQEVISLTKVEDLLRQVRFDGPVTIHYRGGVPRCIEAGKPIILKLDTG